MILQMEIAGHPIGSSHPPFIIAELSANHNGSLNRAKETMAAAKESGAHAVKLQTYTPDTMTIDHDGPGFKIEKGLWSGKTLYNLYQEAYTPWEWHEELYAYGQQLGIIVFSTPFDETALKFLERLGNPVYKIASFELIDLPLIKKCATLKKPMIMSTGMANLKEIAEAVNVARESGASEIALLHCTSGYPTPPNEADINTLPHLSKAFGAVAGLSDHTKGIGVAVASVALGASIIEKHFILNRSDGGPDSAFSLEPDEFKLLCENVKLAWLALGKVRYEKSDSEHDNVQFRRSIYIIKDLKAGDKLSEKNCRIIRPGYGLAPKYYDLILGRRICENVARGEPLTWKMMK
ncbi:MAG: pseudaminic acid synthase [Alphaproteobacteria bacterium]|nr:pseudaminic acid synthase [Alphaproteobacteria bacterium]|tara:strand:+ start:617 stop:1666 length:1050 start_codon:yes stop_codon:yes gene_type:complete